MNERRRHQNSRQARFYVGQVYLGGYDEIDAVRMEKSMTEPIAMFTGTIARVQSMADGSPRFVIDSGEPAIELLSVLAKAQLAGVYLQFVVYDKEELDKEMKRRTV